MENTPLTEVKENTVWDAIAPEGMSGDTIEYREEIVGNVWFREMPFKKKGDYKIGHKHTFDHVTFLVKGAIEVFELTHDDDGNVIETTSKGVFTAPEWLKVPAGMSHTVVAKEDNSLAYCVQAVRDGDEIATTEFCDPNYKDKTTTDL